MSSRFPCPVHHDPKAALLRAHATLGVHLSAVDRQSAHNTRALSFFNNNNSRQQPLWNSLLSSSSPLLLLRAANCCIPMPRYPSAVPVPATLPWRVPRRQLCRTILQLSTLSYERSVSASRSNCEGGDDSKNNDVYFFARDNKLDVLFCVASKRNSCCLVVVIVHPSNNHSVSCTLLSLG